ncbi:hypothetical protein VF14_08785 [Nostoc linckia z18]|uniref:Uncharacterized protein n=2 Tax=Nostoc linckia TaxID=92942 RepID=A0A9Q6EMG9_NOSLI|nr:hypothetical protein [Nostoc linckia]PHK42543.1 hypothetical protein VF12_02430 [Nostoc linckia z15]PHK44517.1 hypothetical protein VF13_21130 [Nostoc linckia z16]PHJ59563.1 hypothetical protein VF02_24410 [Nostoc linckia z1]PHJ65160.1 hypothetical protein VF05_21740 [Nostoc linckia z3]PHJ69566.1 hypothetical protein VF03_23490 [Nostoc linckia z2]
MAKKSVEGAFSSVTDSIRNPQNTTDKSTDAASIPIAPSVGGLIKSFNSAPEMQGLLNEYFGIGDFLTALPGMTPNEIAAMADKLDQLNFLLDNLPAIEQNIINYVQGVVKYHEFVERCVKEGVAGMNKIDQSVLDIFLSHKGLLGERQKREAHSKNEVQLIDNGVSNYVELQDHKLQAALKRNAKKLQADKEKETAKAETEPQTKKPVEMVAVLDTRARLRRLMQYGTTNPKAFTPMKSAAVPEELGKSRNATNSVFEFLAGK